MGGFPPIPRVSELTGQGVAGFTGGVSGGLGFLGLGAWGFVWSLGLLGFRGLGLDGLGV